MALEDIIRQIVRDELSSGVIEREKLIAYVASHPGRTRAEIESVLGRDCAAYLRQAVRAGWLRTDGGRRAARYYEA